MFIEFDLAEATIRREAEKNNIYLPPTLDYSGKWISFDTSKKNGGAYWLKKSYNNKYGWSIWGSVRDWRDSFEPIFIKTIGNIEREEIDRYQKKNQRLIQNIHISSNRQAEEEEALKELQQREVAKDAEEFYKWSLENEIPDNLKYLTNHQIFDTAELKRQKVGFNPNNKTLIIPQYDNQTNLFTGYQSIYQDGRKLYLKGSKQKDVSFTFKPIKENNIVLIAEGFATSACLFLALEKKFRVVSAMTCYNLIYSVHYSKKNFKDCQTIVVADNDNNEIGYKMASLANADGVILIPKLKPNDSDCCDYAKHSDLKAFILGKLEELKSAEEISKSKEKGIGIK